MGRIIKAKQRGAGYKTSVDAATKQIGNVVKGAGNMITDSDKAADDIDRGMANIADKVKAKGNPFKNPDGSDKPRHYGGGGK